MISRPVSIISTVVAIAAAFFALGAIHARRLDQASTVSYNNRLGALRKELDRALARESKTNAIPTGTAGSEDGPSAPTAADAARAQLIAEIKEELRNEMGLMPVSLLRERRSSFVELHAYDSDGDKNYGTAGYLGHGYFITVKHAVIALHDGEARPDDRSITSIHVVYKNKEMRARLIDSGNATQEVDRGDWAIIKTAEDLDLPPLKVDTAFGYEFAEPIFRLGNDYSKGIAVSTGYVGQKTDNGLVTCLTDGHPGVSGGGVLNQRGVLVGIPIGRMQGDYRFSFILPLRGEMFRKVPPPTSAKSQQPRAATP